MLVQGGGVIGLGVVLALRALGCDNEIIALARHPHQADRLGQSGADRVVLIPRRASRASRYDQVAEAVGGKRIASMFGNQNLQGGVDVVYECVGSGEGLGDAIKFCRPRGTVVALGTSQITKVDTTALWFREVTVLGAYGRQIESWEGKRVHTYDLVMDLIREGRLDPSGLLTHVFDISDYRRAFASLLARGRSSVVKAAFRHESG